MIWLDSTVNYQALDDPRIGVILTPSIGRQMLVRDKSWAADNNCFNQGAAFRLDLYLAWLDRRRPYRATCLFATAPDVVGDAQATWARSAPVLPLIRMRGYPAALVAQNGMEGMEVAWDAFDALFIGGSTRWKLSQAAYDLMGEAKRRGKWVHVGRVNSLRRLRAVESGGADSADGTFLKFAPDVNYRRVQHWLRCPTLWTGELA